MNLVLLPNTAGNNATSLAARRQWRIADLERDNSQYYSISDAAQSGLDITSGLTINAWVFLESTGAVGGILSKWTAGQLSYALEVNASGNVVFSLSNDGSAAAVNITSGSTLNLSTWYMVTGVYDGVRAAVYINGTLSNSSSYSSGIFSGSADTYLGRRSAGHFDGLLACVGIWNRAASQQELAQLQARPHLVVYHDLPAGLKDGLVSYWNLDHSTGTTAHDSHGSNHMGQTNSPGSSSTGINSATETGYKTQNIITGARSDLHKIGIAEQQRSSINCDSTTITHAVICRADLWAHSRNPGGLFFRYHDGTQYQDDFSVSAATVQAALVGPYGQDYVTTWARTATGFMLLATQTHSAAAFVHGPLYFSAAYDPGVNPVLNSSWRAVGRNDTAFERPLTGYRSFAVEAEVSMTWRALTWAKIAEFRALNLRWPIFLYDSQAAVLKHKLEHVIVTGWSWVRKNFNRYDLSVEFHRLKHYD